MANYLIPLESKAKQNSLILVKLMQKLKSGGMSLSLQSSGAIRSWKLMGDNNKFIFCPRPILV